MNRHFRDRVLGTGLAMLLFVAGVVAQQPPPGATDAKAKAPAKRAVRPEDYGAWETLGVAALSPDGRWLAYGIARADGEGEMRLRMLATEATESLPTGPGRSSRRMGSGWLTPSASPRRMRRRRNRKTEKTKEAVKSKLGLRNLVSGEPATIDDVATAAFSDDGKFLVMRRYPIKGARAPAPISSSATSPRASTPASATSPATRSTIKERSWPW